MHLRNILIKLQAACTKTEENETKLLEKATQLDDELKVSRLHLCHQHLQASNSAFEEQMADGKLGENTASSELRRELMKASNELTVASGRMGDLEVWQRAHVGFFHRMQLTIRRQRNSCCKSVETSRTRSVTTSGRLIVGRTRRRRASRLLLLRASRKWRR